MSTRTRSLWIAALTAFVVGGAAVVVRLITGHRYADYGSYVPWGLWVGLYVFLVWLEVGTVLAFTGLVHVFGLRALEPARRHVLLLSLVVLLGALAQIGLDLGHLGRAWRPLLTPNFRSPMAWMIWLHVLYLAVLAGELVLGVRRTRDPRVERWAHRLSLLDIPLGLALVAVVASVFGVSAAQPLWSGFALPLFFVLSALVVGGAMVGLVHAFAGAERGSAAHVETLRLLGRVVLGLVAFGAFAVIANVGTVLWTGTGSGARSLLEVLGGRHAWSLWLVHGALGIALPAAILADRGSSPRALTLSMALVVLGFVPVPMNLIVPPLAHPQFASLLEAWAGPGLGGDYFPSLMEWAVSLWVVSAVFLGMLAGERWLGRRPAESMGR